MRIKMSPMSNLLVLSLFNLVHSEMISMSKNEEDLQVVYVSQYGFDNSVCGSVTNPCRHLIVAVKRVAFNGTIQMNGTQTLNETIKIQKHVHITGMSGMSTIINGNVSFAFELSTFTMEVILSHIHFQNINVVNVLTNSSLEMDSCVVTGSGQVLLLGLSPFSNIITEYSLFHLVNTVLRQYFLEHGLFGAKLVHY